MKKRRILSGLLVLALLLSALSVTALAASSETLFSGSQTASAEWSAVVTVYATNWGGSFDGSVITEGSAFTATYTGTAGKLELVLQGEANGWAKVAPSATSTEGDVHTSTFSYADLVSAYGASDFSDLGAVNICSTDDLTLTVTGLVWTGTDTSANQITTLFSGEGVASSAWGTAASVYTTNWGGGFNPKTISEGGAFCIYYSASSSQVQLVLQGTGIGWAQIEPSETRTVDGGYIAIFPYSSVVSVYTDDMASTLGAVNAVAKDIVPLTVTKVMWYPAGALSQIPSGSAPEETEPETTDPETTDPETTDPETTDPETTDPETTEPEEGTILSGTEYFSGEKEITSAWTVGFTLYAPAWGGSFNPATITEDGFFQVVYSGTPGAIELVIQDGSNWSKVAPCDTKKVDGGYVSLFSYEDIVAAYPADLSELCAVNIGSTEALPLTLKNISWVTKGGSESGGSTSRPSSDVVLFSGSAAVEGPWSLAAQVNLSGLFDPAKMNEGGYITVTYTGTKGQIYFALADWDSNSWKQLDVPSSTAASGDGYISTITYADLVKLFGKDFSAVDAICVGSGNATGQTVITNITWHPGNPDTGDSGPMLALATLLVSVMGIAVVIRKRDVI